MLWRPDLVWIHAVSDLLIALAYFSIPLALTQFVRQRRDLRFKWIFWMFAGFITACGLTHLAGLVTLWQPYYGAQGLIKAGTALVSLGTAVAIWPLIPKAVALPTPVQLEAANNLLRGEISQRVSAEEALRRTNHELELRVAELAATNQQLLREINERERAEAELRRAFAMLDHHVNNTPLGVIEWQLGAAGQSARVRRWSGRAQAIFGWDRDDVLGRAAEEFSLIYEGDAIRAGDATSELTESRRPFNSLGIRCYTKDGKVRHCQWYNSALHDPDGSITILSLIEDITDRVAALEDTYRLAHHDTLTGLPNRLMLYSRLDHVLASARRHGRGVALMMIDLDHFKNVNDSLGHVAGDELLRQVADRLRSALRESDTLARVGGDEFVLLAEDVASPHGVSAIARKIVDTIAEPFDISGSRLYINTSVGVTLYPRDAGEPALLLRNADLALYRAKREGRGQYQFYSPDMDLELRVTRNLENGLRRALKEGTLELFYQPTYSLADGRIQSVEALVRWRHEDGGHVMPASFIPIAETSGLIVPLGEWVLREACRQAQVWSNSGYDLRVAVNVSAIQLREPTFALLVERVLADNKLGGNVLELEVTERVFLDPSKTAITETLRQVTGMGVRLAIDDFGTGYSSLGYLKNFPFDRIKIDASFVQDIGIESGTETIVKAIIGLSRSLGKSVTAEGVETNLQLSFLRHNMCDEAQGFLLAHPAPADSIAQSLKT
jgi:diguanylate cyclase (GGDEF)-like protein/PAS domain S-box-containing protein